MRFPHIHTLEILMPEIQEHLHAPGIAAAAQAHARHSVREHQAEKKPAIAEGGPRVLGGGSTGQTSKDKV